MWFFYFLTSPNLTLPVEEIIKLKYFRISESLSQNQTIPILLAYLNPNPNNKITNFFMSRNR